MNFSTNQNQGTEETPYYVCILMNSWTQKPCLLFAESQSDNIGGLQILRYNHWVDAPHLQGSLLANVGDILQLISNDKFKSVMHRVVAGSVGNRVSASCFFLPVTSNRDKTFGPVKELLSEVNPPIYREISYSEYIAHFKSKGHDVTSTLNGFQL
ncbi:1-aminocyclopropane-1-carboxylate oxidase homolog 1-like isoform X3 [Pistacia vera]|uniref:1-aminocyclopropane-1-carboxylate oxidase homolog 1-like isoform X3 n=1 Tax=Pistacia vera TaxID=55513 RepID=UPI001263AC74|nr:1-aminocyclopropane-1-carboxylate oxidase homolog 1-like isoform X3 [Pistacia vera]